MSVIADIESRLRYAEACGESVAECRLAPSTWEEFRLEMVAYTGGLGLPPAAFMGIKVVRDENVSHIALAVEPRTMDGDQP